MITKIKNRWLQQQRFDNYSIIEINKNRNNRQIETFLTRITYLPMYPYRSAPLPTLPS